MRDEADHNAAMSSAQPVRLAPSPESDPGANGPTPAMASAPDAIAIESPAEPGFAPSTWDRLRNIFGNICLALLFSVALLPTASPQYHSTLATRIWFWGAVLMVVMSLVRVPPRSVMFNLRSLIATAAMMVLPMLMRPGAMASTGWLAKAAIVVELIGITFTQISRVYLGRRFGLLPANRGIVSSGPFRWMRHPIYSGWAILTIGFLMAYPNVRNIAMFVISIPFMVWRISLEEEHLTLDPEYRAYLAKTPWRLFPHLY
jgi:protein-S-isoprenylcysteine O-methyltransferase Ste14